MLETPAVPSDTAITPDFPDDPDRLGDAIAELAARIQAATHELLVLIREFDARRGWAHGFRSCAHWLNWRTGLELGAAREKVRVAHALAGLPQLSAAMRRGQVSYSKVRAITRVATPDTENALLDVARAGTAAHVERLVRAWRRVDRTVDAAREDDRHRHASRHLETWVDEDGMVVIRGRLAPEVGAVVRRALDAASEQIQQAARAADTGDNDNDNATATATADPDALPTAGQRRADALGLVAETALAADLDRGTAGDRYQVVLHVDAATNEATLADADGVYVSAETSRRLSCDASRVVIRHGPDGSPLDVGRKTRTIPPALRRALTARDRRCRFPGCESTHCDAHHLTHWADGGATKLDNLLMLCRFHHRAVHEDGLQVTLGPDGEATFVRPEGAVLSAAPPPFAGWDGAAALAWLDDRLDAADVTIDPHTATPAWDGERFDVAWAIDVLWRQRPPGAGPDRTDDRTEDAERVRALQ